MTGRQDLAAVIAEMRKWASYKGDPSAWIPVGCTDNQRIREWAERLALLLVEAQLTETKEVTTRVEDSQYGAPLATASEIETGPALDEDDIAWLNAPMGPPGTSVQEQAHAYLSRLLVHHAPQCEPLPDLMGLCTQIDNLLTGLPSAALPETSAQQEEQ